MGRRRGGGSRGLTRDLAGVFGHFCREINSGDARPWADRSTMAEADLRERGVGRTERAAIFLRPRRASLTDSDREGVEQVGRDEDDVGTGLHAVVVLPRTPC